MSINMDQGSSSAQYADHEVQTIGVRLICEAEWNDGVIEPRLEFEPVHEFGIDNDELAELVGFYRNATIRFQLTQDNTQTELGDVNFESDFGINVTEEDVVGSADEFTIDTQEDLGPATVNDGTFNGRAIGGVHDNPGQIDHVQFYGSPSFNSSSGAGGPGNGQEQDRTFFYPDKLGSGPYVDRTDDLVMLPEIEFQNCVSRVEAEITYILYWNLEEMPEGRASFARP